MEVRACRSVAELRDTVNVISHYFGSQSDLEDAERFARVLDVERTHAIWEGDRPVAGAGAFSFEMSVPGGATIPMAAPRGELAELLTAYYPETRLSDMILTRALSMRLHRIILWLMFFAICFGLGYPTLNRYDTSQIRGTSDSLQYFRLVVEGPSAVQRGTVCEGVAVVE